MVNTYVLKYRILKFFYNYAVTPRDPKVEFVKLMEAAVGCTDKQMYAQCTKELVEMQYMKSNWGEISKKGIWFLDLIRRGDPKYDDSDLTVDEIITSFNDTEYFFGRIYEHVNLDENSGEQLRKQIEETLKHKSAAIQ